MWPKQPCSDWMWLDGLWEIQNIITEKCTTKLRNLIFFLKIKEVDLLFRNLKTHYGKCCLKCSCKCIFVQKHFWNVCSHVAFFLHAQNAKFFPRPQLWHKVLLNCWLAPPLCSNIKTNNETHFMVAPHIYISNFWVKKLEQYFVSQLWTWKEFCILGM